MVQVGEVITLDNGWVFAVVEKVVLNGKDYYVLMTTKKPVKIKVCTVEGKDQIILFEDKKLIKEVLLRLL